MKNFAFSWLSPVVQSLVTSTARRNTVYCRLGLQPLASNAAASNDSVCHAYPHLVCFFASLSSSPTCCPLCLSSTAYTTKVSCAQAAAQSIFRIITCIPGGPQTVLEVFGVTSTRVVAYLAIFPPPHLAVCSVSVPSPSTHSRTNTVYTNESHSSNRSILLTRTCLR
jgi:hypothetical protein